MVTTLMICSILAVSQATWSQPETEPEPAVLEGPSIEADARREVTLVRWGYQGRLVRLDTTPEQAALELLDLEPSVRERVDAILAERMTIFDQTVIESLDLISRFESAKALKNTKAMRETLGVFMGRLAPLVQRGPASMELARAMPREQAKRFQAFINKYHKAVLADEKRLAQRERRKFHPIEVALKARGDELGQEIERSIKRSAAMADAGFDMLLQSLELDPEVEAMIRSRTLEFVQKVKFNPTKEQEDGFMAQLFIDLDRESRVKIMSGILKFQSRGLDYGFEDKTTENEASSDKPESNEPRP
jgi:hypothetical protein